MASKIILRKMVLTLKKELGILLKIEIFLISSAKRKSEINKMNNRKIKQSLRTFLYKSQQKYYLLKFSSFIILLCTSRDFIH